MTGNEPVNSICTCFRCEVTFTIPLTEVTLWERTCGTIQEPPPTWYIIKCPACSHENVGRVSFNIARAMLFHGCIHVASETNAPGALEPITEDNIDKWSGRLATMTEEDVWKELT